MLYRTMGRTGVSVSALGFGCMRFLNRRGRPTWGPRFDTGAAISLLMAARDAGVNYFDTAYNYMGGKSESVVGEFLRAAGSRKGLHIATKLPVWLARRRTSFERLFSVQLSRLGVEHVDFYLLHALNESSFARVCDLGVLEFLDSLKKDGRISFAGFSFHDKPAAFAPIVDAYGWDFCQIQYNIVDENEQAGRAGLEYAAGKGLGVVVMEPLRGGDLTGGLPESVETAWKRAGRARSAAGWCLSWVLDQPGVSTVLSGMNTRVQLDENAGVASAVLPGTLTASALKAVGGVQRAYRSLHGVGCTKCGYCMPCPAGVSIPRIFMIYNEACMFPGSGIPGMDYNSSLKPEARADRCTGCGLCESRCPQRLPVREKLREASRILTGGSGN